MHPRYGRRLPLTREQGLLVARGAWFTPSLTVVVATLIHLLGEPRAIPFFISETDTVGLQGFVFTVGLTVSGVVQMAFAWHLYHELDAARPTAWFLASLLGLVAATNTVLVSHFDMYDHINPHIWTALLAFGGGLAWAFFAGWAMGPNATQAGRRLRRIGFSVAAVSFTVMMVAFQRAANRDRPHGPHDGGISQPNTKRHRGGRPGRIRARCRLDDLLGLVPPRTFCERGSLINGGTCERTG